MLKAFLIRIKHHPDFGAIYWNETAGKARYRCLLQGQDVGFDLEFSDIMVRRIPKYDYLVDKYPNGIGLTEVEAYG